MWFQRSKAKWLAYGDRNTKYYHLRTLTRRRKNKIIMLKDEKGQWVKNGEQLKRMVNEYYKKLFTISDSWNTWRQTQMNCPSMDLIVIQNINNQVNNEEIKNIFLI